MQLEQPTTASWRAIAGYARPHWKTLVAGGVLLTVGGFVSLLQPLIAKQILPWFGGTAAVWAICMVFFQVTLLAGYAYSDWLSRRLTPRQQVFLHVPMLAASLIFLPIVAKAHWKPTGSEDPTWLILGLLVSTIGLPYFLLSTTSPLIQAWFARTYPDASPYRLFALSNLASMLALLGYPFLIEPRFATRFRGKIPQGEVFEVLELVPGPTNVLLAAGGAYHALYNAQFAAAAAEVA